MIDFYLKERNSITGRINLMQSLIDFFPVEFRLRLNPDRYSIDKFISIIAKKVKFGSRVLDAGCGPQPYRKYFSHCKYEGTDFNDEFTNDFICSLDNIPRTNSTYDAIICTQVLEHVEYPQKVLNEFYRILKKDGELIMTVPQCYCIHQEPYNFYYFTKFALESMLRDSGFKDYRIKPRGGYFWLFSAFLRYNVFTQQKSLSFLKYILFPVTHIIAPLILFYLDKLDKEKLWTLGYAIIAKK